MKYKNLLLIIILLLSIFSLNYNVNVKGLNNKVETLKILGNRYINPEYNINYTELKNKINNIVEYEIYYKVSKEDEYKEISDYILKNQWEAFYWKIIIEIDIEFDINELIIIIVLNKNVTSYEKYNNNTYFIDYQDVSLYFDYSDMLKDNNQINIGVNNNLFWFSIKYNNIKKGKHIFDPYIGYKQVYGMSLSLNNIEAVIGYTAPCNMYVTAVEVYMVGWNPGENIRAIIYDENDNLLYNGTDNNTGLAGLGWVQTIVTNYYVFSGEKLFYGIAGDNTVKGTYRDITGNNHTKSTLYTYPNLEDPATWTINDTTSELSIVVYYIEDLGEPELIINVIMPLNNTAYYFISNITIHIYGNTTIFYNLSINGIINFTGNTVDDTEEILILYYYLTSGNYIIYINASDINGVINDTSNFIIKNPELDGSLLSGILLEDETIVLLIWLLCVLSILFGKNKYIFLLSAIFLDLEILIFGGYYTTLYGLFVVATIFFSLLGYIRAMSLFRERGDSD